MKRGDAAAGQTREGAETTPIDEEDQEVKTNLTYHLDRYVEECSPMCVYIPNRALLWKMMRACIGVSDVGDLWIYHCDIHGVKAKDCE